MRPIDQLDGLDDLVAGLTDGARRAGVRWIWRAQAQVGRSVVVREGRAESTSSGSGSGHGMQVVTAEGGTAFAHRDDFRPEPAARSLERAIAAAAAVRKSTDRVKPAGVAPERAREIPDGATEVVDCDLGEVASRLADLEARIVSEVPGVRVKSGFRGELDAWRIAREDGTDVRFAAPRCTLTVRCTARDAPGDGGRHGVGVAQHFPTPDATWSSANLEPFLVRAVRAARLALALPEAPRHPAGSHPVVIDYALAKGLAHEAFGHASEADGLRGSVLATEGRFDTGRTVGARHVSIVDEPIPDDHAWQPYSANGVRRDRATIVRNGRLEDALVDLFTAGADGVRLTGAARAATFRDPALPRMTNIRIDVDGALPAPGRFEDYGPDEVRDLLARAGVFRRHREVAFLSGYAGGQVNTAIGDFVFQCKAIWALSEDGVRLHRPAIFSGSMFGALGSIREAFGPSRLDALGWCGKWGQSVSSSGGSHWFLVLDPDPAVRLGGGT